ncbi:MAG: thiamine pyrophosphate-dependent dehydrogenase E1 component subunit alpha [Elusimicrobia bacterium]|nr:thiamine pyrophosphate-dependent dehydrogenase E1 component subunit alpha [Elusimicrobiota bacterium]
MKDEMKTPVHMGVGGEAIPVGVLSALPTGTKTFGTYRNHSLFLASGGPLPSFFAELYGRLPGPGKGKAGSMHLASPDHGLMATSAVVGTTIPLALGAAFAEAYRGGDGVVAVFFGDGAVEEGVFWESLNFAALRRLRVLFVCEDNGLAIHTPIKDRQGYRSLTEAVAAFHCFVDSGDGADAVDVRDRTAAMAAAMRRDGGPGFLHLPYLRALEHVGPNEDWKAGYRPRPSDADLERWDPVRRLESHLKVEGHSQAELDAVRAEVAAAVDKAAAAALAAPFAGPEELWTDVGA